MMNTGYQRAGRLLTRVSRAIRKLGRIGGVHQDRVPYRDYYAISIYSGRSPLELEPATGAQTPVLSRKDVTDVPAAYVADPFMIRVNGCWHMYFEVLREDVMKGVVGHATSLDGLTWNYHRVVLEEPFHLSYPCVFECDGDYFMIPESNLAKGVRLYKADQFPAHWTFVGNLLDEVQYVDCSPFQFGGKWWLFAGCGTPPLRANMLRLFHANRLTGPWTEHPASPVVSNNPHIARPAGRVVIWQDRLLRFAQDCSPRYGLRVHAYEITELTEKRYAECAAAEQAVLKESYRGWNAAGMHHMDCHPAEGGACIACVDGWYWGPVEP